MVKIARLLGTISNLKTTLAQWVPQYNYFGINELAVSHRKQNYSLAFKLEIVQAVKTGRFSIRQSALYFGIP